MAENNDVFGARTELQSSGGSGVLYRIQKLEEDGIAEVSRLPYSIKVLLEAALRQQPFRDQFDNLAGLVSLTTDSNFGLTFEIFAYNLVGNLRDNLPDDVTAEAVESAVGSLRRSFPLS